MYTFIEVTPKHRPNPPTYATYPQYKDYLIVDFKKRCAYCNDTNKYRVRSFAIDHFIPQKPLNFTPKTPANQYDNLIYCCSYCNRAKWNKWPTDDEAIENDGNVGFVKPTKDEYKDLFFRNANGRIIPIENNNLSLYLKDELMLWHPIHSLMWRIEKLIILNKKVKEKIELTGNKELKDLHYILKDEIIDIFENIFELND